MKNCTDGDGRKRGIFLVRSVIPGHHGRRWTPGRLPAEWSNASGTTSDAFQGLGATGTVGARTWRRHGPRRCGIIGRPERALRALSIGERPPVLHRRPADGVVRGGVLSVSSNSARAYGTSPPRTRGAARSAYAVSAAANYRRLRAQRRPAKTKPNPQPINHKVPPVSGTVGGGFDPDPTFGAISSRKFARNALSEVAPANVPPE